MLETTVFARNAPRRDIVGIDLLRFAAALSVLVYHLGHRAWAPPIEEAQIRRMIPDAPAYPELEPVAWLGWVGVEIFFVISGYVIASSAERASPFAFARSRALRLAPAIWVCSTITLGAVALVTGPDSETLKLYARTLALPFFPKAPWIDSVYWTLIVELVFYAMIFALLLMDAVRKIGAFAMTLGMVSSTMWFAHAGGLLSGFVDSWAAHLSLLRHGCFFAAGVLLWLLIVKRVTGLRLAVLLICVTACLLEISDLAQSKAQVIGRDLPIWAAQMLFIIGLGAIACSVIFNETVRALFGRAVIAAPLLGMMTYPLYLVHNIVGVAVMDSLNDIGLDRFAALGAASAAMVVLAWFISGVAEPWIVVRLRVPVEQIATAGQRLAPLRFLFRKTSAVPART